MKIVDWPAFFAFKKIVDPFVIRPDDNYLEDLQAQEVYLLPTSDFKLKLSYLKKN